MKLTKEQGQDLVYGDLEDWETVEEEIIDNSRWSIHHSGVFKHVPTGKFYRTGWSTGATESQDESPFDYSEPELTEVVEREVIVKQFVPVSA